MKISKEKKYKQKNELQRETKISEETKNKHKYKQTKGDENIKETKK